MPKKKKTEQPTEVKGAKKVQVKQLKKVSKKTSRAKSSKKEKKVVARSPKTLSRVSKRVRPLEITKDEQIMHAAETYAVSIDEIIRSGNREYKMMQTNGRGQEITAPSITAKKLEAAQPKAEIEIEKIETIVSENIESEPQDALSEEDKKALAIVRAKLESQTVMIRSVSPLQTPFAHSSRNFVKSAPQKTSKAPLVFLSSAAIVFAAFVVAVVVSKTGNFGPAQMVAPQAQKVAGAETGPQQYEADGFTFSYPGNWYASQTQGNTLTLRDSQKTSAETVSLAKDSLDGRSFQDWLKDQKDSGTVQSLGTSKPEVYQASDSLYYVAGSTQVIAVSTKSTKQSVQSVAASVAKSLVFTK